MIDGPSATRTVVPGTDPEVQRAPAPELRGAGGSRRDATVPPSSGGAAGAVARLLLVFAGGVGLAIAMHAVWVLVLVLAFVAMVMLHELGHFATAKWSGM